MKTLIIGGGVIGLTTAWSLHRRGHEVEIIEAGRIGESASAVNAGWVVPSLPTPLASPGMIATGIKETFKKDGALVLKPKLDTEWIKWLWQFRKASRPEEYRKGVRALLNLNQHTIELFDELRSSGVEFEMHAEGMLALALSEGGLAWFSQLFDEIIPMGFPGAVEILTAEEARSIDPSVSPRVRRAALTSIDRHVNPDSLLAGLKAWLEANGVLIHEEVKVLGLVAKGGGWNVETDQGPKAADRVVVALGAAANTVLSSVGVKLPLIGAKGYSVTVTGVEPAPKHALYLMESKLGLSPFSDGVRVAGVFELPGRDNKISASRIESLISQARPYVNGWDERADLTLVQTRTGLRPATPNSLPFLGEVPDQGGLFVAVGHGMVGVTLAPATGEAIADLIEGKSRPDLHPFALPGAKS